MNKMFVTFEASIQKDGKQRFLLGQDKRLGVKMGQALQSQ